ncbi:MAG TPA: glycosyltransferase [Flavobacterium sp.]|nr:glycosyltransferase [Flavobacterium sp.]
MEAIIILPAVYLLLYAVYIGRLIYGFWQVKKVTHEGLKPKTTFSIVVPFRNEADNLPLLLESIKNLNYPKELFEMILVDDFSEDQSQSVVYKWRMENGTFHTTLLENVRISNSPKKDAISRAVPIVVNDWIITTDADCIVPETWLSTYNDYIQNHETEMIAGGVLYQGKARFLDHFQQMDLLSLQGATIGSFGLGSAFMCNGANFAYTKKLYLELNGFAGNNKIASGDDVFLLQKAVAHQPKKVHYLKSGNAIVTTKPVETWKQLFYQRVRWASKAADYESEFGEVLAWVVFFGNVSVLVLGALAVLKLLPLYYLCFAFAGKFVIDSILMIQANVFLRKGKLFFPLFSGLLYPFFSVAVALYSFYGKYEWKGRKLK